MATDHTPQAPPAPAPATERRQNPRRRLRDRIASAAIAQAQPTLRNRTEFANLVLLVEDDLREAALALGRIEQSLAGALEVLEHPGVTAAELQATIDDLDARDRVEALSDSLDNLRHHLHGIAASLK